MPRRSYNRHGKESRLGASAMSTHGWWLEAGTGVCPCCEASAHEETFVHCVDCDRAICPICFVEHIEFREVLCPDCAAREGETD